MKITLSAFALLVVACLLSVPAVAQSQAQDWIQFRGSGGTSVADAKLPREFDDQKNVAWKKELPGKGASGPIVVGDRVIVTCSGGNNQDELYTICFDAKSGKELWRQQFWATGRCFVHETSANAAPTPASDGERVFAFFSSNDLACLDLDGNLQWYRGLAVDFPKAGNDVGMSSSPVVKDGIVVVQVECAGDSFAMALDAITGETVWTVKRDRAAVWSSPLVTTVDGRSFVVLQSKDSLDLLDLKSGDLVYQADGNVSSISSAATAAGKVFAPINGTTAYAMTANGNLQQEWNNPQIRPSSMSAVVNGDRLYIFNRAGAVFVYDTANGNEIGKARVLQGTMWSTPVVANGLMYCFTENGNSYVVDLSNDKQPEVIHKHAFEGENFLGSPAVSGDAMYVRSNRYLYKFAK